jgi:hypothetical protein
MLKSTFADFGPPAHPATAIPNAITIPGKPKKLKLFHKKFSL